MGKATSDFIRVASTSEIPEGKMRRVIVGSQQVLIVNVKGKYYAIGNVCRNLTCGSNANEIRRSLRHRLTAQPC